jgi:hypothetical protein
MRFSEKNIEKKIKKHTIQKQNTLAKKIIDTTGVISTSDPDSRQIMTRNNISEVPYVQTTVDALHDILIDFRLPMKTILKPWWNASSL